MSPHVCACLLRPSDYHCLTCGLTFGSDATFSKHLRGPLGKRRHATEEELMAMGLVLGVRGRWGDPYKGPQRLGVRGTSGSAA